MPRYAWLLTKPMPPPPGGFCLALTLFSLAPISITEKKEACTNINEDAETTASKQNLPEAHRQTCNLNPPTLNNKPTP